MSEYPYIDGIVDLQSVDNITITDSLYARISLQEADARGNVTFVRVVVSEEVTFARGRVKGPITFVYVESVGRAVLQNSDLHGAVTFDKCIFYSDATFSGARLHASLTLADCTIKGTASFDQGDYEHIVLDKVQLQEAFFTAIRVKGQLTIANTTCKGELDFAKGEFRGSVTIASVKTGESLQLDDVRLLGHLNISLSEIGGDLSLAKGNNKGNIDLCKLVVNGALSLDSIHALGHVRVEDTEVGGDLGLAKGNNKGNIDLCKLAVKGGISLDALHALGNVHIADVDVSGDLDLSGGSYNGNLQLASVRVNETLTLDSVTISIATLVDVQVQGTAAFTRGEYFGPASFKRLTFHDDADFRQVIFRKSVVFESVVFEKAAVFAGAEFGASAIFRDVTFKGAASFRGVNLRSVTFTGVKFMDEVALDISAGVVIMERVIFSAQSSVVLRGATLVLKDSKFSGPTAVTGERATRNGRSSRTYIADIRGTDLANVSLVTIDVGRCHFSEAFNLDDLRLESSISSLSRTPTGVEVQLWPPRLSMWSNRLALQEEVEFRRANGPHVQQKAWAKTGYPPVRRATMTAGTISQTYRQLRKAREDAKDEPGAADFYYGEMEMRRAAAQRFSAERFVLWLYWLVSGYGLRASRSLMCLAACVLIGAVLMYYHGFNVARTWTDSAIYSTEAITKLTAPPRTDLSRWGRLIDVALRLAGPIFLGLAILSVRGRTKR